MYKAPLIAALAGLAAIAGTWYFLKAPSKPMTIEQCRSALAASIEFQKIIDGMDETNRAAAYDTGAMRCVLDHDPETSSWSDKKKSAVVAHVYCEKQAGGNYLIQASCEAMAGKEYERVKKYGVDVLTTPANLKPAK